MDTSLDTSLLPDAFGTCACCVRESLDAAGVLLDCASTRDETEEDAWHMP
jgi:hypothetical protein